MQKAACLDAQVGLHSLKIHDKEVPRMEAKMFHRLVNSVSSESQKDCPIDSLDAKDVMNLEHRQTLERVGSNPPSTRSLQ